MAPVARADVLTPETQWTYKPHAVLMRTQVRARA
jgi:hypothetical protein